MKFIKTLALALAAISLVACGTGTEKWTSIMPDGKASNWGVVGSRWVRRRGGPR